MVYIDYISEGNARYIRERRNQAGGTVEGECRDERMKRMPRRELS
jgi:hypothetical protein